MKFICRHCNAKVSPDWQYCQDCGKRLPLKTNQRRIEMARQLAEYQRANRARYEASTDIVRGAQLVVTPNACEVCRLDDRKVYKITELPDLPHQNCDCYSGCGCDLIPILNSAPDPL
jgi:hypothetical protein